MRARGVFLGACILLLASPVAAQERSALSEFGLGTAAVVATILWGPPKVLLAVGGTAVASLAWVVTGFDKDVGRTVLSRSVRGDYVVTPEHVAMERPLSFFGRDPRRDPNPYRR